MAIVARSSNLEVHQLPAFENNYLYIIYHRPMHIAWLVDPGDYEVIESWRLKQTEEVTWGGVLITHHHHDHVGGLSALVANQPEILIYGSDLEKAKVPHINRSLAHGSSLNLLGTMVQALSLPGHTLGLMAYRFSAENWLFVGDALFAMGCGRLFEGSYDDLFGSLTTLRALPPQTLVFCAHEYTERNAQFARELEPHNRSLQKRAEEVMALRDSGKPTVPFSLEIEFETNPFFRLESPEIRKSLNQTEGNPLTVLRALRERRNQY